MRRIAGAIKQCPEVIQFRDECAVHYIGPPVNAEWDVLPNKTVRAPLQGIIEFTLPQRSEDIDPSKQSKKVHQKCLDMRMLADSSGFKVKRGHYRYEFDLGSDTPEWQRAEAAMSLALCTTMRGCEIKRLQWRDVDFLNRAILVRTSKTEAGQRSIPMNDEAEEIVVRLRDRARAFNGTEPQHYVFPACEHGDIDPTQNQRSFRTAWRNLTRAIECPACSKFQKPGKTCAKKGMQGRYSRN